MALVIDVKVVPGSGRNEWVVDKGGQLKCFLKNLPEKGLANNELIKLLAKILRIPQNDIEIIAGAISRKKTLKIHTALTKEQLLDAVGVERQALLF